MRKLQTNTSMSRQQRGGGEAPSDGVAGTWKRFSAASTSATWEGGPWGVVVAIVLAILCYRRSVVRRRWVDVLPELRDKKIPHKQGFTGHRGRRGGCRGSACPSNWLLGWCRGHRGWCSYCFVARV